MSNALCPLIQDNNQELLCHNAIKYNFLQNYLKLTYAFYLTIGRGGSRTAATSKMEHIVIVVNGFQPLTIITKSSILDVAAVLDPPLIGKLKMQVSKTHIKYFRLRFYHDISFGPKYSKNPTNFKISSNKLALFQFCEMNHQRTYH